MKKFLFGIFLVATLTGNNFAMATYVPQGDTIVVGGVTLFPKRAGFKILSCYMGQTTPECTMREPGGSAGYVVPGSKTFKVYAVETLTESVAGSFALLYADNDVGMAAGGSSFTNPVYIGGSAGLSIVVISTAVAQVNQIAVRFDIPTGKYPGMSGPGGAGGTDGTMKIYGYEE